jgi:hypothetical protein
MSLRPIALYEYTEVPLLLFIPVYYGPHIIISLCHNMSHGVTSPARDLYHYVIVENNLILSRIPPPPIYKCVGNRNTLGKSMAVSMRTSCTVCTVLLHYKYMLYYFHWEYPYL